MSSYITVKWILVGSNMDIFGTSHG